MINLNATGRVIWQGVSEGLSEDEIADRMTKEFDVDAETAKIDVHSMILKMQDAGVMTEA